MVNGVSISEYRLLAHTVFCTVVFLILAVALVFLFCIFLTMKNPKEKEHLRRLRERARKDEGAKKQFEKIQRKKKRRRKREKENIIVGILIWSAAVCVAGVILIWGIIPGWTDYVKKDYVVYKGEIAVYQRIRLSHIELADGTTVWGVGDFDDEDTSGTVVYSRRTKRFLGGSK